MVGLFRGSLAILNEGKVVRPSQLIRGVRWTWNWGRATGVDR
jgi:hypothetical protein